MGGLSNGETLSGQVLAALPQDAAGLARAAALLTEHALQRAADERAAEAAELREALRDRDGQIAEVQQRADTLHGEHTALAQDLLAAHEQCEALAGQKAALVATVKQLADKLSDELTTVQVRKLEGFKKSLLSNLAEEAGTVLPAAASPEPLPDGDTLVNDILASSKPEALPARPSLVHLETQKHGRSTGSFGGTPPLNGASGPDSLAHAFSSLGAPVTPAPRSGGGAYGGTPATAAAEVADRSRVNGKEFFKDARNRLPYDGFHDFLQVIKDLNAGVVTREEAVASARRIFGPAHADLHARFQQLLVRHLSPS